MKTKLNVKFLATTAMVLGLAAAAPAGAVIIGFSGTTAPGVDPLGDAFSTHTTSPLFFDMGPEKFNTAALTLGDVNPLATIFQFTLNNGVKNGIQLTAANTFFEDITTSTFWTASFQTISGSVQQVTFTAPGLSVISPGDKFQAHIGFVAPLQVARYSWAANWDNTSTGVPEPMTWALMLTGFGLAGATLRRRRETLVAA